MNGAAISASAQQHSTVDTSTTEAELTECFKCAQDVMGFRNLMEEVGLMDDEPTTHNLSSAVTRRDLMNGYALVLPRTGWQWQQTNWCERDVHLLGRSPDRMS
jgi:hypothetical protein